MKILFVTNYAAMYGANRSMLNLMLDLRKRYDVEPVVLMPCGGELEKNLQEEKISYFISKHYIWAMEKCPWVPSLIYRIKAILINPIAFSRTAKQLKNSNIDLIHTNTSISQAGAQLAKKLKIPHVWHVREYGELDYHAINIYGKHYIQKKFGEASCVIAISDAIQKFYKKSICPNANIVRVYNGVKDTFTTDHAVGEKINFCCVGLIRDTKNQFELVRAAKILADQVGDRFVLHLIGGGDPDYIQGINDFVQENHLAENVKLWGYRNDVTNILKDMDVGLMPSLHEAFGRVTVEYMLECMPVIGADSGGTPELIRDGETGYLYPLGDAETLAKKMESYVCQHNLVQKHGLAAREFAKKQFQMEHNTDNIYQIYQKVLQPKSF